jgi:hypothetical protein
MDSGRHFEAGKRSKKAVGMISGLNSKGYEERCAELGLQTLEERRYEQDIAMVHKFSTRVGNLAHEKLFKKIPEKEGPVTRLAGPQLYGIGSQTRHKKKLI